MSKNNPFCLSNKRLKLEYTADSLLSKTKSTGGDYPAYSERSLRHNLDRRGEYTNQNFNQLECIWGRGSNLAKKQNRSWFDVCDDYNTARISIHTKNAFRRLIRDYVTGFTVDEEVIVRLFLKGMSIRQIVTETGFSQGTVQRRLVHAQTIIRTAWLNLNFRERLRLRPHWMFRDVDDNVDWYAVCTQIETNHN